MGRKRKSVEVIAVGSKVLLGDVVSARITAIFLRKSRISYECVWWVDHERKEEVVESWEVRRDGKRSRMLRIDPVL